jgi:hypothetical protein
MSSCSIEGSLRVTPYYDTRSAKFRGSMNGKANSWPLPFPVSDKFSVQVASPGSTTDHPAQTFATERIFNQKCRAAIDAIRTRFVVGPYKRR